MTCRAARSAQGNIFFSAPFAFARAAHGGGVKSPIRRRGDGRRRPGREPEAAAEGHRGGGDPARLHPVQRREPLPLGAHLRRPGKIPAAAPTPNAQPPSSGRQQSNSVRFTSV